MKASKLIINEEFLSKELEYRKLSLKKNIVCLFAGVYRRASLLESQSVVVPGHRQKPTDVV